MFGPIYEKTAKTMVHLREAVLRYWLAISLYPIVGECIGLERLEAVLNTGGVINVAVISAVTAANESEKAVSAFLSGGGIWLGSRTNYANFKYVIGVKCYDMFVVIIGKRDNVQRN